MEAARIICEGATIGSITLPPFKLFPGELLCLHLPSPADTQDELALYQVLTGRETWSGVRVFAPTLAVNPAMPRRGLRRLLGQPTVADWLANENSSELVEAKRQVSELGLRPMDRLDHIAGTSRLLLGVASAWNRGAEALVFSLTGLDPLGLERVVEVVRARLDQCPAILLSYPYTMNGEWHRFCPAGAKCVEARHGAAA